ncbi:DNA polymerase Y family protein [Leucobacter allii]|uniref:DNA polymerase Y family protein n=1 Tax=Leucobacter allii TaxID=2932247 RepID=UPI001FD38C8C|nr:DNA polymerase Y family protein [Leucobacter allii]UOR00301.1 DNA polymerase Y family protein [Leucobacter allii]
MSAAAAAASAGSAEPADPAGSPERVMVFWVPDWPVHAHLRDQAEETASAAAPLRSAAPARRGAADPVPPAPAPVPPLALVAQHRVTACSASARAAGVRVGQRERDAQSTLPALEVHPHRPEVDARRFAPVLAALEERFPGIEPRRPGLCALRARGPARYYGGEESAAQILQAIAAELDLPGARVGIADGVFAAEQAARAAADDPGVDAPAEGVRIVPPHGSAAFLAELPVSRASDAGFAEVLHGLGIRTLGALAALPEDAVRQRFGAEGIAARRRASAAGPVHGAELRPRAPARDYAVELVCEPPIDAEEQLSFACMSLAEACIGGLAESGLVCTALRIELTDDIGVRHEREWAHPRRFSAADAVGRIRWQAAAIARDPERGGAGIARVRIVPVHTDRAAAHEPGLWSTEPDDRVHHHLSRTQSRLGHTAVGTAQLSGGRLLVDRQRFVPWSIGRTRARRARDSPAAPWPGAIPGPAPSTVFPRPLPAALHAADGAPVGIDADELLTADPAWLGVAGARIDSPVQHWSRPWTIRERWWEGAPERFRLQLQLADGDAWLLIRTADAWLAEGRYD